MKTYKVTLNWYGEIHEFYKVASSDRHALMLSCRSLGEKLRRSSYGWYGVRQYFLDGKDRWIVKEVRKDAIKRNSCKFDRL